MIALYAPLNASSFLALMVVLYRWRHGTQAKHSSSDDVRRTVREGIYYDQGTGIGAIFFDLARWHGAGSVLWGAVTQHAGVAVALFGAAGGLLVSLVAMVWYPFEESKQADLIPSCRARAAEETLRVSTLAGPTLAKSSYS
jgi:hypothetical protein